MNNIIFNLTCLSLSILSKNSHSPIFYPSYTKNNQFFSLVNSEFSRLFSPITRSKNDYSQFVINACRFSKIIDSILIFETDFSFDQKIFHQSIKFENSFQISIKNCQFIEIILENDNKSAITSCSPMNIENSIFHNIKGYYGSCIQINSSLFLRYDTFDNNYGQNGGCFFIDSLSPHETIIKNSIFHNNTAKYSSLFYRNCIGDLVIQNCNISNSESTECVGVFENTGAIFTMEFSLFEKCKARVHYGGIVLNNPHKSSITNCAFYEIAHNSNLGHTASTIFISHGKNDNYISSSEFCNCSQPHSYAISSQKTQSLTIYNCTFSLSRTSSIHYDVEVSVIGCQFDADIEFPKNFFRYEIGYLPNRNELKQNSNIKTNKNSESNRKRLNLMIKYISIRFLISFIFASMIASVINYFHIKLSHAFKSKTRRERL